MRKSKRTQNFQQVRGLSDDSVFFATHPGRSYRLRRASFLDLLNIVAHPRLAAVLPVGCTWFAVVREIDPYIRASTLVPLPCGTTCDLPEAEARVLWDLGTGGPGAFDDAVGRAEEHLKPRSGRRAAASGTPRGAA